MLSYLNYFKTRYLGQKGQGMVEYAVIIAVVVAIGVALIGGDNAALATKVSDLYQSVFSKAATSIGGNSTTTN